MDPDATLIALLDACRDDDRERALAAIAALHDWLSLGGLVPIDPRRPAWMQPRKDAPK